MSKRNVVLFVFVLSLLVPAIACKEGWDGNMPSGSSKALDFGHKQFTTQMKNHSK